MEEKNNGEINGPDHAVKDEDPSQIEYDLGKKSLEQGDQAMAALSFHNAVLGFEESGNEKGVAKAVDQLGDICMTRRDYDMALTHFQRSYEICDKFDDLFSLLSLNKKMAEAHRQIHEYDKAIVHYFNMLDIYGGHNNPAGTVAVLESLSETYLEQGQKLKAADALRTAASIHANFRHARAAENFREKARQIEEDGV